MGKAYSTDLRLRVLANYDDGVRPVNLADRYRVSERWVYKLLRQRKGTGCIEPRRGRTGPKPKLAAHKNRLRELIDAVPDATLEEMKQNSTETISQNTDLFKFHKCLYNKQDGIFETTGLFIT